MTEQENKMVEEFEIEFGNEISKYGYVCYRPYDGKFQQEIEIDGNWTANQLRRIADLMEKYQRL